MDTAANTLNFMMTVALTRMCLLITCPTQWSTGVGDQRGHYPLVSKTGAQYLLEICFWLRTAICPVSVITALGMGSWLPR